MARRYRVNGMYVIRRRDGTFSRWQNIGRATSADKRKYAWSRAKSGYRYRGD